MIKLQQITKIYHEKTPFGVSNINLRIDEGEFVSLIGPSGSGKSTLLNIIDGSLAPDQGSIDIKENIKITLLKGTEVINEDTTVIDFLLNQIKEDISEEQKINAVRTTLSLFELTTEINKKPYELSSGQYQRVLLSKCLVQNPNIILLDEPFSHLDLKLAVELREEFFKILKDQDIAILWATHDLNSALAYSDKIAVINLGKIEQYGSPKEIYETPKNIFVADLFPNTSIIYQDDGYYCYRPESIIITQDGQHRAQALSHQYQGGAYLVEFKSQESTYFTYHHEASSSFHFEFNKNKIYPITEL